MRPVLPPYASLPPWMRRPQVAAAWRVLDKKRDVLAAKRALDLGLALLLLPATLPVMGAAAALVLVSSPGPAVFRQRRVTAGGRCFTIYKLRTMEQTSGSSLAVAGDSRVTPVGEMLRKYRVDELPQLFNILRGEMSFVGPRPELPELVACYTPDMLPTLLLPAGVTSPASLCFRDESKVLALGDSRELYLREILPAKMAYNLQYLAQVGVGTDLRLLLRTVCLVLRG